MNWLRDLEDLVARTSYKDGWSFGLTGDQLFDEQIPCLLIRVRAADSVTGEPVELVHQRPMPANPKDERQLRRWLFEQIVLVERHEAMEFFKVDGVAPYFPDHRPGGDPYALVDREAARSEDDRWGMTIGSGQINDPSFGRLA